MKKTKFINDINTIKRRYKLIILYNVYEKNKY